MDVQLNDSTELVRFKDYSFFVPMDCAKNCNNKRTCKK